MAIQELDYMEYTNDANAQAAYVTSGSIISNADIDDEDMAGITDWTDADSGSGVSSQVTFDGKSCMKLLTGTLTAPGDWAYRTQDIGTFGNRTVFSLSAYFDAIGLQNDEAKLDDCGFDAFNGSTGFTIRFASDGLFIYKGSFPYTEVGTNLVVQDTWQKWTFDVNWVAKKVDIYLNGVLKSSAETFNWVTATANGTINLIQSGDGTANRLSYIDWFKAGSKTAGGLECFSENSIKTQGSYSLKGYAMATDSLNKTLTRTVSPTIDLSNRNTIKFDIRSSRTGTNIKVGIHDSGGTTTELTPTINSANTWETKTWDISAVANSNKDSIDRIIVTVVNADANNTFYIDNMYAGETLSFIPKVYMFS